MIEIEIKDEKFELTWNQAQKLYNDLSKILKPNIPEYPLFYYTENLSKIDKQISFEPLCKQIKRLNDKY